MIVLASCTAPVQSGVEVLKSATVQHKQEGQKLLLQNMYTYEFDKIELHYPKMFYPALFGATS